MIHYESVKLIFKTDVTIEALSSFEFEDGQIIRPGFIKINE